jgi:hypothetical protein
LPDWIDELQDEIRPRGFEVGLVTADSYWPAKRALAANGVQLQSAVLISLEKLWDFAPLR